jgi:hypothetical protein
MAIGEHENLGPQVLADADNVFVPRVSWIDQAHAGSHRR